MTIGASPTVVGIFIVLVLTIFISAAVNQDPPAEGSESVEAEETLTDEGTDSSPTDQTADDRAEGTQLTDEASPTAEMEVAIVSEVIDGDTIRLESGETVRYIGIDTPETKHPRRGVECYGQEASNFNSALVRGKEVRLETDVNNTDRFDRLLRYVYVDDIFVNEELVRQGYAHAKAYPPDTRYQERFEAAELTAQTEERGLWGKSCEIPVDSAVNDQETPSQELGALDRAETRTAPIESTNGVCQYDCAGPDQDCSDFSTRAEAQSFFDCCGFTIENDPMNLDSVGSGDGRACESLP